MRKQQKTNLRKYFSQIKKRFPSVHWRTHHLPDKTNGLKKSVDIILNFKIIYLITLRAMVFSVVMYECESWTVKKAEHWRIDAFELWCWRRLLRVPWTARRSNKSILKEISPGISLEGMMLKLKLQYFGHLMWRVDSLEKTGKDSLEKNDGGQEKKGTTEDEMAGWHHWLDGRESEWTLGVGDGQGGLACCDSWGRKELDSTERLNWTETFTVQLWAELAMEKAQDKTTERVYIHSKDGVNLVYTIYLVDYFLFGH